MSSPSMIVRCPTCQTQYRLDAARLRDGKGRLRCARCRTVFPVGEARAAAAEPPRAAPPAPPPARLDVAMLAAEAGPVRQRMQASLQALGMRVVLADDGPNALDVARRTRPRLLAATAYLPMLSGHEVLLAAREEPALAQTRTLLIGGPELRLRRGGGSEAGVLGTDARIAEDAKEAEITKVLKALLGAPGGELPAPTPEDLRAEARVAASDLLLYYASELEAGRREGRLSARVTDYLAAARASCVERYPSLRWDAAPLSAYDDEIRLSLRRHA